MDIKHITSDTLRSLLGLTDKKDQLIKAVAGVEDELAKALKSITTTALDAVESVSPGKSTKPAKLVKKKRKMSREARARISAATKARWAARRAGKSKAKVAPKAGKPAKVKKKGGITPAGRAKLAANMKARWAARRAAKP